MAVSVALPAALPSARLDCDDTDSEPIHPLHSRQLAELHPPTPNSQSHRPIPNLVRGDLPDQSSKPPPDPAAAEQSADLPSSFIPPSSSFASATLSSVSVSLSSALSASPLSPLRQFPTVEVEVHDTILEENDETDCDSPNEPVTPVSGRQSRDSFQHSDPEPESDSSASVPIPIPIPAAASHGHSHSHKHHHNYSHNHHNHHNHHRHSNSHQSRQGGRSHHRSASDTSGTAGSAEPAEIFLVDGNFSIDDQDASKLRPLGLSPESAPRSSCDPNRPSTAVGGSFLINPDAASVARSATTASYLSSSQTVAGSASEQPSQSPLDRRPRGSASTTSFKRTMTNLFRRSNSQTDKAPEYHPAASAPSLADMATTPTTIGRLTPPGHRKTPSRRWSMHRSLAAGQAGSPPSPDSPPLEMALGPNANRQNVGRSHKTAAGMVGKPVDGLPTEADFLQNDSKRHRERASTSISLHNAIHIVTGSNGHRRPHKTKAQQQKAGPRRANSFDQGNESHPVEIREEPWILPAEAGTGLKARRMSLSLPDDFAVDAVDLHSEFEYQHVLGRHRRHLGKGATSKVTLMFRKGFPDELYAVKEFRGKSSSETREEYEKKVKSEFSIAKSLHHPNVVETIRLCTDHGRWDHVMEYCQEGDLYSMVEKKYLTAADREKDRLCLFKQLVQGLHYLHAHGIAHRDIKLENLLVTSSSKLRITDFGASDIFSGIHPGLREAGGQCGCGVNGTVRLCRPGICGSLPYISPEVVEAKAPYDPRKLDVWAAAVVMLHLIFGGPLWSEARIRPGQANPQYASLVRGWGKWNARHLAEREEAEMHYQEKKSLSESEKEKEAAATVVAESSDEKAAVSSSTAVSVTSSEEKAAVRAVMPAAVPAAPAAPAVPAVPSVLPLSKKDQARPLVPAEPLTDGNPNSIVEGAYPAMPAMDLYVNPPVLRRVLLQMLNPDPKRRVTIDQVANLRWVRNIECCQPENYDDPLSPCCGAAPIVPIDASKRASSVLTAQKIFFHDHLPPKGTHSHSIGRLGNM